LGYIGFTMNLSSLGATRPDPVTLWILGLLVVVALALDMLC
jgi:hypothetical protein